jgi:hypothetical protein
MGCLPRLLGERMSVTAIAGAAAALLCGALSGCSFVLDSSNKQCSVDTDCEHFGNHPSCQSGVCVESGLGPPGCFFATQANPLAKQTDFLNQCTTSTYETFDNCARLKLGCPSGGATMLPPPVPPTKVTPPAPPTPTAPTIGCTDTAPPDATGTGKNVIWMYGSADFGPLMAAAQPSLYHPPTTGRLPYRAVFQASSSCNGVNAIYKATASMADPAPTNTNSWAFFFDDSGTQQNCWISGTPNTPGTHTVDVGISDLFPGTCSPTPNPGIVPGEYQGPVVPFVLATKTLSTQQSISAEAAHLVFGNGGTPPPGSPMLPATPWLDSSNYFIRNAGAGSTVLTAQLITVDRSNFWGVDRGSTDAIRDGLINSTDSESAIGILSIDFYDKNRGSLKALYLQSTGQTAGYQPDSTPTTLDKINVRDGHYPLWGYVHLVVALDHPGGNPVSPAAGAIAVLFNAPALDQGLVDHIIAASEVPQCAMKVKRTDEVGTDGGNFVPPPQNEFSCGCYFDFKTTGKTTCQACNSSEDCPTRTDQCNYGFCEVGSSN